MERPDATGLGIYFDNGILNWLLSQPSLCERLLRQTIGGVVRPVVDPADLADISETEGQAHKQFLNAFVVKAAWAGAPGRLPAGGFAYASRGTLWKVARDADESLLWDRLLTVPGLPPEAAPRLVVARHQSCSLFVTLRWAQFGAAIRSALPDAGFTLVLPDALHGVIV